MTYVRTPRWKVCLQDPYILLNVLLIFAYIPARYFLNTRAVTEPKILGLGYETMITIFLTFYGQFKYRSTHYLDDFIASLIPLMRVVVLFLLFQMNVRVMTWFLIATISFTLLAKRRLYSGPSQVAAISHREFQDFIADDDCSDVLHIILFFSPKHAKSNRFRRDFIELSLEFTCDEIKFYSADVVAHPEFISDFSINMKTFSVELPVVAGIYRGEYHKAGRIPALPVVKAVPSDEKQIQAAEKLQTKTVSTNGSKKAQSVESESEISRENSTVPSFRERSSTRQQHSRVKAETVVEKSDLVDVKKDTSLNPMSFASLSKRFPSIISTFQESVSIFSIIKGFDLQTRYMNSKRREGLRRELEKHANAELPQE